MRTAKWLRSGVVAQNIESNLDSTLDTLTNICQIKNVTRETISDTLRGILQTDMDFRQQHSTIYKWFRERERERERGQKKKKQFNIFNKKTRIYSFAVGNSTIENTSVYTLDNKAVTPNDNISSTRDFYTKLNNEILQRQASRVPIVQASTLNNNTSRSSEKVLLRGQDQCHPLKRKLNDTDFDQMTDFVLGALKKVKENVTGEKQKILKLSLDKDETLIKIWRAAIIKEKDTEQINKFVMFSNSMFNMNLSFKTENQDPAGFTK